LEAFFDSPFWPQRRHYSTNSAAHGTAESAAAAEAHAA